MFGELMSKLRSNRQSNSSVLFGFYMTLNSMVGNRGLATWPGAGHCDQRGLDGGGGRVGWKAEESEMCGPEGEKRHGCPCPP